MCHKSIWTWVWVQSGEQVLGCQYPYTDLFTALLGKTECFGDDPKEKTQQNQCFAGF